MWDLLQDIELPLTRVLIEMEKAGIFLDCYHLGEITGKLQDQMEDLEACIYDLAGRRVQCSGRRSSWAVSSSSASDFRASEDQDRLLNRRQDPGEPAGAPSHRGHLLNHRELSKLMSTYLMALPQCVDARTGRLHTTFHQTVAATGRLSSSHPNLQNIPVADHAGRADQAVLRGGAGQPAGGHRLFADRAAYHGFPRGEPTLLEALARGEDIHRRTAAEVFGMAPEEVDTTHRRYAKAVNFGIMYGITVSDWPNLDIPREEAAVYIQRYLERLSRGKRTYSESVIIGPRRIRHHGAGRRRPIPELGHDTSNSGRSVSGWR